MCVQELEEKHQNRLVMKQHVWKPVFAGSLDILEVIRILEHQQINYFLKISQDYNEYLIRVFYSGLHDRRDSTFKFTIGNTVYDFIDALWKSLFDIIIVSVYVEPLVTYTNIHQYFKWNIHLNELLKAPWSDGCVKTITTGMLKMVPHILLSLVSHISRPKNGGYSRIDNAEIHLVYIFLNKIRIIWANYSMSQMFAIKECNKVTSFCYVSMIAKILNYFNIGIPNLQCRSPIMAQEFSVCILTNMG